MKKVLLLLLTLMTFGFATLPASAQSTLTVANGTVTNEKVPFYCYYLDQIQHTQIIYPSTMLTEMIGKEISKMEFYMSSTPTGLSSQLSITLGISSASQFEGTSFDNTTLLTPVYYGDIVINNNTLIIEFSTPYLYTGGNLMFNLVSTAGTWSNSTFYGIESPNASLNQYFEWYTNADKYNFLPKTTFTYFVSSDCPKATNLTASNLTSTSATISWNCDPSVTSFNLQYMLASETDWNNATTIPTTSTSVDLNNLQINTSYKAVVQSLCDDGETVTSLQTLYFSTPNTSFTPPYSQDFETTPQLISDFTFMNAGPNKWAIGPATFKPSNPNNASETGFSMYISDDNGSSNHYETEFSSKAFAILNVTFDDTPMEHHLTFDYKTMGENYSGTLYDYFALYLVDGDAVISTNNTPTGTLLVPQVCEVPDWVSVDITLPNNVAGTTKKLVFYWQNDGSYGNNPPVAVDNISLIGSTCSQPNLLSASGITTNSATLHWNEIGSATDWTVYYKAVSDAQYTSASASGSPSLTITGLNSDTYYTFYVVSDCGDDISAPSASFTFRTLCDQISTLPYTATFDEPFVDGGSEYVTCWSRLALDPSHMVYFLGDVNYTHNGSAGCLDFAYTPYCWTMAIMPAIASNIPMSSLMLDFYLVKTGETGVFEVGVMTDPTDASTFQVVHTINSTIIGNNAASYEHHVVTMSNYTGNGQFIAFRASNSVSCGFRLDDLIVSETPACMVPINFQKVDVYNEAALLTWTEVGNATAWNILYGPMGFDPETGGTMVNANTIPFTVGGLQNVTTYDFYVRSNCGSDQSVWTGPVTLKTGSYNMGITGSDTMVTCGMYIYDDGGEFGNYSESCDYTLVIYPATEGSGLQISGTVNTYDDNAYYLSSLAIYEGVGTTGNVLGFYTGIHDVELAYGGPVTLRFISSDFSYYNRPGFELLVQCTNCFPPTNVTVNNITETGATVSWAGESDSYLVHVDGPTSADYTTTYNSYTLSNLTSGSPYYVRVYSLCGTDTSLSSQEVYFTTSCGSITVTNANPWVETFESYPGTGSQPFVCWATPVAEEDGGPYVNCGSGEAAHSGTNSAELTGYSNLLALPVFTNDIHDLRLSFWATGYNTGQTTLEVGVIADLQDPNTFETLCFVSTPGEQGSSEGGNGVFMGPYDFNAISATSGRLAFRLTSTYGLYANWNLDDFTVSLSPSCPSPLKQSVTVSDIYGHAATIHFIDNDPSHTAWTVYYKSPYEATWNTATTSTTSVTLSNLTAQTTYLAYVVTNCGTPVANPDATDTIQFTTSVACPAPVGITAEASSNSAVISWIGNASSYVVVCNNDTAYVTTNTATFTGLAPSTQYIVSVMANCEEEGLSVAGTAPFTTACDIIDSFPYFEGFEANSLGCWSQTNLVGNNSWLISSYYPNTGFKSVGMSYTQGTSSRLISPVFDLTDVMLPMISFYQRRVGWSGVADSVALYYRTSLDAEWVRIKGYHEETSGYVFDSVILPSPSSSYQISFVGYGIDGYSIYLDDIMIYDGHETIICDKPTGLHVNDVASTTAHVEWTPGGTETAWKLQYKKATTTNWGNEFSVTSPSYTLSNLQPSTPYHVRVKAACGANEESDWTNLISFTTAQAGDPTAPTVTTQSANNLTSTSATLHAAITNPDNVTVSAKGFEWKPLMGDNYTSVTGTGTDNNFSANLTGLTPNTDYIFKAYIVYNGETIYGNELTFTTENDTPEPCDVPTGLHTTNIENHSITIAWDDNENVENWNIQYKVHNGSWSSAHSTTNSYTMNALAGSTVYEIQVQANCGDELSDWCEYISAQTTNVGIENWLENSVTLFPNPAKEYVDIRVDGDVNVNTLEVYDVYGKWINTVNVMDNPTRINVNGLANGMYFVRVTTDKGMVTKTFVKK